MPGGHHEGEGGQEGGLGIGELQGGWLSVQDGIVDDSKRKGHCDYVCVCNDVRDFFNTVAENHVSICAGVGLGVRVKVGSGTSGSRSSNCLGRRRGIRRLRFRALLR